MSNAYNDNDRRLKQDTLEKKDKENTNAGMIGGVVITLLGIAGLYIYYNYEAPIESAQATVTASQPAIVTPVSSQQTNQSTG